MTIPREAVEAATEALKDYDVPAEHISFAITAALPHLAPKPTDSDEERAWAVYAQMCGHFAMMPSVAGDPTIPIIAALAAVRAEEREAMRASRMEECEAVRLEARTTIAAQATQIAALREAARREIINNYGAGSGTATRLADKVDAAIRAALEMSGG